MIKTLLDLQKNVAGGAELGLLRKIKWFVLEMQK